MKRKLTRLAVLLAVVGLVSAVSAPALADPPAESGVVTRGTLLGGFFYFDAGLIVLAGSPDFAAGCVGEGFTEPPKMTIQPGNGSSAEHVSVADYAVLVFATDVATLDAVGPWIGAACQAALDDDPTTVAPEPAATGAGTLKSHVRVDTDGVAHAQNSIVGQVTTADGRTVHLRTIAKLTDTDGALDIHQLRIDFGG